VTFGGRGPELVFAPPPVRIDMMKRKSLSQLKNLMRRALSDLVDRPATASEQAHLRTYFDDRCAYCGATAGAREGHIDHADSRQGNAIGNLLLACKICNGDEKREAGWEDFLRMKCGADETLFEQRYARIRAWRDAHPIVPRRLSVEVGESMKLAEEAIRAFEDAFNRVRDAVASEGRPRE
jgi:hypothetical protein